VVGIISGIIAYFLNLALIRVSKPKFKISSIISKEEDGYRIKFINKTLSDIENLKMEMFIQTKHISNSQGDEDYRLREVKLKNTKCSYLAGLIHKDPKLNDNCVQLFIEDDLENIWKDDDKLIFQITAYNRFTGVKAIQRQELHCPKESIKKGKFKSGQTIEIINNL
ncbi:MAG: hypothetical protein J5554_02265, partial [Paludibacteraceae bacterium]|nr:hypothetical protein [Paludibacteraceae bacterium]